MRRAARQGNVGAQYFLDTMYFTGQGVDEDPVRAHMWLDLAAWSGHIYTLTRLAKSMTPEKIGKAGELVAAWKATKD